MPYLKNISASIGLLLTLHNIITYFKPTDLEYIVLGKRSTGQLISFRSLQNYLLCSWVYFCNHETKYPNPNFRTKPRLLTWLIRNIASNWESISRRLYKVNHQIWWNRGYTEHIKSFTKIVPWSYWAPQIYKQFQWDRLRPTI